MKIESDAAEFVTGVRGRMTLGTPITLLIANADFANWSNIMGAQATDTTARRLTCVRPGHADLSGVIKYGFNDARNVLERASARETAVKVGLGAVAKLYLKELGITVCSHTVRIGSVDANNAQVERLRPCEINARADNDAVRCLDAAASQQMCELIDQAKKNGDTLGGVSEILVFGCKSGIGSYSSYERKLDGIIMRELGAVQSVKAVEIGDGVSGSARFGSQVHDAIYVKDGKYFRKTNRSGGIEGGMTNGAPIVIRAYFKPIPTLMRGLDTVDIESGNAAKAASERSDVCAVAAGGVVAESAVALGLCAALSDMLGGDTMSEAVLRYNAKNGVSHD